MKFRYTASVTDEDTDEVIAVVSAYSMESLEEQLRKLEHAVERKQYEIENEPEERDS